MLEGFHVCRVECSVGHVDLAADKRVLQPDRIRVVCYGNLTDYGYCGDSVAGVDAGVVIVRVLLENDLPVERIVRYHVGACSDYVALVVQGDGGRIGVFVGFHGDRCGHREGHDLVEE